MFFIPYLAGALPMANGAMLRFAGVHKNSQNPLVPSLVYPGAAVEVCRGTRSPKSSCTPALFYYCSAVEEYRGPTAVLLQLPCQSKFCRFLSCFSRTRPNAMLDWIELIPGLIIEEVVLVHFYIYRVSCWICMPRKGPQSWSRDIRLHRGYFRRC